MYLFSRSLRLAPGNLNEAMTWAVGLTEKVNQIVELDVSLWTRVLSPAVGTLSWTAMAQDLEELEAGFAKLAVDGQYNTEVARGAQFVSAAHGADDTLAQVVYGELDPQVRPAYVAVAMSQLLPGQLAKGMEVGIEIAKKAEKIGGASTVFAVGSTGPYGNVAWISGYESIKQLEAAEQAVNGDPSFVALIDSKGSKSFNAAATQQIIVQRIV